jgi:hydroxypyruvate reductase
MSDVRELCRAMFDAAVARAQPAICLPAHFPPPPSGRLIVFACGKAGALMAETAERHYLDGGLLPPARLEGICVTRHGHGRPLRRIRCIEAGHPVPDDASVSGTEATLALAATARPDDLALVLISGGGSANWSAPLPPLDLAGKQELTRALLRSGAPIGDINVVRKHLSRIKGGRLAAALRASRTMSLVMSDVPGDDLSIIASGPTVPDESTSADARAVLTRWGIEPTPDVAAVLSDPRSETPMPGDAGFERVEHRLVARPADSLEAAAALARERGYAVQRLGDALEGEARVQGEAHARLAIAAQKAGRRVVFLSGGELTVTVTGSGRGGPNQEYALAAAITLAGTPGISGLAADTDGIDGGSGAPTDPAGAYFDGTTPERAAALNLNPAAFLKNNDATQFFSMIGDSLTTGPTGTNVNDFRCVVVDKRNGVAQ